MQTSEVDDKMGAHMPNRFRLISLLKKPINKIQNIRNSFWPSGGMWDRLNELWKAGEANYLISGDMKLRFVITASIINSVTMDPKNVLDIGCGVTYIPEFLHPFTSYHGIDVAPWVIEQNRRYYQNKANVSFSVEDLESFERFDAFNIIICLGYAYFSDHVAARPDKRLRKVLVSRINPHRHGLIILDCSNDPKQYKAGVEDVEWMVEFLKGQFYEVTYKFTFASCSRREHTSRLFVVLSSKLYREEA